MTEKESELDRYVPETKKAARDFLGDRAIIIMCPECLKEDGEVELRMGTLIYHFAFETHWSFDADCPRCVALKRKVIHHIHIDQSNYTKFLWNSVDKKYAPTTKQ